jgi:hypothetical protein
MLWWKITDGSIQANRKLAQRCQAMQGFKTPPVGDEIVWAYPAFWASP